MCLAVNLSNHQGCSLLIQRSAVQQGLPGEERPAPRHSPGSAQGIGMAQQLHPPNPQGLGLPLTSHRHHTPLNLPSARVTELLPRHQDRVHPCLTQVPLVTDVPTGSAQPGQLSVRHTCFLLPFQNEHKITSLENIQPQVHD